MRPALLAVLPIILGVAAHKTAHTEEEKQVERSLRNAAYHCAAAVGDFTTARKRAFAQKALGQTGNPSVTDYAQLFDQEPLGIEAGPDAEFLSCTPIQDTQIENNTCVLTPEVTEGPYYHNAGHPIRQNIAEYQDGLLLLLDIGVIDVETCKPVPNVLVDIWLANATGHYAGHPDPAPHLVNEQPQVGGSRSGLLSAFPRTKYQETFLRGAWPTDRNGVSQFTSIFPGYYTGRATHIHTKVYPEWTVHEENSTFTGGRLAHVGQWFFEDDINMAVDKMHPYTENPIRHTRGRTRNWRDSLNIFDDSHLNGYNPVFKTHLLGGVIGQGVVAYITMGVNMSASYDNWWKG
ncbi:Intradiol ring-cleavage dioxygenase [Roridomyces roridus]|uniref:Intradiol ring-cleavage dioxygenase n=1 Tax=Roridomyces roridus TaxID=1738132 RepID=A0AAD7BHI9_9AGAR|nr:Intradiol ring-cleavage dioxygenase [Roridomyces roridus]